MYYTFIHGTFCILSDGARCSNLFHQHRWISEEKHPTNNTGIRSRISLYNVYQYMYCINFYMHALGHLLNNTSCLLALDISQCSVRSMKKNPPFLILKRKWESVYYSLYINWAKRAMKQFFIGGPVKIYFHANITGLKWK